MSSEPKSGEISLEVDHPLQNTWVLWYDNQGKVITRNDWAKKLQSIYRFSTVEDFWRLFNNIRAPSEIPAGSNYHLFKEGIEPKWEDPKNSKGGKWVVKTNTKDPKKFDELWLDTLLACIGETLTSNDEVCGAVASLRKAECRISVWVSHSSEEENKLIGQQLKTVLRVSSVSYYCHDSTSPLYVV